MSTTIPALSNVSDILDTDLIIVTHSTGDSYKMSGADFNKRNQVVIAPNETPTTLTGTPLKTSNVVRVYWKVDLTANSSSAALSLSYNNVSYTVKVPRNGSLVNFTPFDLGNNVYVYLQAYTEVDFLYDGTNFVLLGNPVLISTTNYSIYADGIKRVDEVVSNSKNIVTSGGVADALDTQLNAHIGQNYCLIPNANGIDRYTTVRFSTTNWGIASSDLYGIIMTYYSGEDFYINAKTGEAHPIDPVSTRSSIAYITGIYVDFGTDKTLYIKHGGYRGFFIRFQGNLISVETSATAPTGIIFNDIVFSPNTTTREIKSGIEEER